MRQEPEASHPSRPHAKEGRLVMPPSHVFEVTGTSSKEGAMQAIGTALNRRSKEAKEQGKETSRGPAKGDRRRRAQRKSFKHRKAHRGRRSSVGSEDLFNIEEGAPDPETFLRLRSAAGMRPRSVRRSF